jgi:hypothetical protein
MSSTRFTVRPFPAKAGPDLADRPGREKQNDWPQYQAGRGAAPERIAALRAAAGVPHRAGPVHPRLGWLRPQPERRPADRYPRIQGVGGGLAVPLSLVLISGETSRGARVSCACSEARRGCSCKSTFRRYVLANVHPPRARFAEGYGQSTAATCCWSGPDPALAGHRASLHGRGLPGDSVARSTGRLGELARSLDDTGARSTQQRRTRAALRVFVLG